jgi:predicted DNA-binding transcriptional regulator AlpA
MAEEELLTIVQVTEELKISRATFYRWRSIGRGPRCVKLPNGSIRIRRSQLDKFVLACEEPETATWLEAERRRGRRRR